MLEGAGICKRFFFAEEGLCLRHNLVGFPKSMRGILRKSRDHTYVIYPVTTGLHFTTFVIANKFSPTLHFHADPKYSDGAEGLSKSFRRFEPVDLTQADLNKHGVFEMDEKPQEDSCSCGLFVLLTAMAMAIAGEPNTHDVSSFIGKLQTTCR